MRWLGETLLPGGGLLLGRGLLLEGGLLGGRRLLLGGGLLDRGLGGHALQQGPLQLIILDLWPRLLPSRRRSRRHLDLNLNFKFKFSFIVYFKSNKGIRTT